MKRAIKIKAERYHGFCKRCGKKIEVGETVTLIRRYGVECEKCNPDGISPLCQMINVDSGDYLNDDQRQDLLLNGSEYNFEVLLGAYKHFLTHEAIENTSDEWSIADYDEWESGFQPIYAKQIDGKFRMCSPTGKTIEEIQ